MKQLHKYILIGVLWVLPLSILWFIINDGRYYIGGDVMIPLNAAENLHKLPLWQSGQESLHYLHASWYLYYYALELAGVPSQAAKKILIIFLFSISSYCVFKLHKLLFKEFRFGHDYWPYVSAFIFLYNPIHFLVAPAYLPLYGYPVVGYIFARFLRSPNILLGVLYAFALNFFFFIDLPQPKMLLIFIPFVLTLAYIIKIITPHFSYKMIIIRILYLFFITIVLHFWLLLPYVYSTFRGEISGFVGNIASQSGDADLGTAQLLYITRFFNLSTPLESQRLSGFLLSTAFTFWSIFLLIIAFSPFFYKLPVRLHKIIFIIFVFTVSIFFLAKGSNAPLGFIYRFAIIHVPVFRVFRTTAVIVAVWVVFYSFLVSLGLYLLNKYFHFSKNFLILFFTVHLLIFHPIYLGYKYFSYLYNEPNNRGKALPSEYLDLETKLKQLDSNARIFTIPFSGNYVSKKWGYFGPDIVPWLSGKNFIVPPKFTGLTLESAPEAVVFPNLFLSGISYFIVPKDNTDIGYSLPSKNIELLLSNTHLNLYKLNLNQPPEFYLANNIVEGEPESISSKRIEEDPFGAFLPVIDNYQPATSSGKSKSEPLYPRGFTIPKDVTIKYETINQAHFILNLDLQQKETLVFMDFYDKDWRLYPAPQDNQNYLSILSYLTRPALSSPHNIANGHYNSWELDPQIIGRGTVNIQVVYYPQILFYWGVLLSVLSLCVLILVTIIKFSLRYAHT